MEANWTTFLLEIINFLVLVWILKRFLYKPVLGVIARRRAGIEQDMSEARALRKEAESLRAEYQQRLADWEQEKRTTHTELLKEIGGERERLLQELAESLAQARERNRVLEEREARETARNNEKIAVSLAAQFASRLFSRIASPELEARLVEVAMDDLGALPANQLDSLRTALGEPPGAIQVTTGYPLRAEQRSALQEGLAQRLGSETVAMEFHEDPELLAGLRIELGSRVLGANLRDELAFFAGPPGTIE